MRRSRAIAVRATCAVYLLTQAIQAAPGQRVDTIAVLNFASRSQGDARWSWLSKGIADLVIGDLASQGLRIVSREQMAALVRELELKHEEHDPDAVARILKASRCISGTFLVETDQAQINASLIDASSGQLLHSAAASGPVKDILELEKKLAAELAEVLLGKRPGEIDPRSLPRWTDSVPASQSLYDGVDRFDRGQFFDAWVFFRRALHKDPRYADALYWSGRMMYYLQEYHHAVSTFDEFVRVYPKHPRAGDAVMEIINSAQISATSADEVLAELQLAMKIAPRADVHNQFATGVSSNVAVYCAGLAAQIFKPQERHKEAFDYYAQALTTLEPKDEVYRYVWKQMLQLTLAEVEKNGQSLPLPQPPALTEEEKKLMGQEYSSRVFISKGGDDAGNDDFLYRHQFVRFSARNPRATLNFGKDGFKTRSLRYHFCAPPGYFLTGLKLVAYYDADTFVPGDLTLDGEEFRVETDVNDQNGYVFLLKASPNRHFLSASFVNRMRPSQYEVYPIQRIELEAELIGEHETAATLLLEPPQGFACRVQLNGLDLPILDKPTRYKQLAAGHYHLHCDPHITGWYKPAELEFDIDRNEEAHVQLAFVADPRRRLRTTAFFDQQVISTPYEPFRMGVSLGDRVGELPGEVQCVRDRRGRYIIFWTMRRDLYMVISTDDGRTWSPTTKLPAPVNSAHDDKVPLLFEDDAGRFVLCFVSDRNLERAPCTYVCWTEDLVHFSSPQRLCDKASMPVSIFQRDDGTYLVYMFVAGTKLHPPGNGGPGDVWLVTSSADLVQWTRPREFLRVPKPKSNGVDINSFYRQRGRPRGYPRIKVIPSQTSGERRSDVPAALKISHDKQGFKAHCLFVGWGDKNPPNYHSADGLAFLPILNKMTNQEASPMVNAGGYMTQVTSLAFDLKYRGEQYAVGSYHFLENGTSVLKRTPGGDWQQVGHWSAHSSENEEFTSQAKYQASQALTKNQMYFGGLVVREDALSLVAIPDVKGGFKNQVDPWFQPAQPLILVNVPRDVTLLSEAEKIQMNQRNVACTAKLLYRKMKSTAPSN